MWAHIAVIPPPVVVPMMEVRVPFFFMALIFFYRRLISFWCAATVSTEFARLVDNFASGTPFATVCVVAAAMMLR